MNQEICCICFEELTNLSNWYCKKCHKQIHRSCIKNWINNANKSTCPLCRYEFVYSSNIFANNLNKVNWSCSWLSEYLNSILVFEKNLDKVDWSYLSQNPNNIHLLEKS
jgi:hypothetical protein